MAKKKTFYRVLKLRLGRAVEIRRFESKDMAISLTHSMSTKYGEDSPFFIGYQRIG